MVTIETKISGIPCQAEMLSYYKGWCGSYDEPPEPEEADFQILDRKGYKASWLEKKMTDEECYKIEEALLIAYHEDIADEKAQRKLDQIRGK